jgi:hypothetical protein
MSIAYHRLGHTTYLGSRKKVAIQLLAHQKENSKKKGDKQSTFEIRLSWMDLQETCMSCSQERSVTIDVLIIKRLWPSSSMRFWKTFSWLQPQMSRTVEPQNALLAMDANLLNSHLPVLNLFERIRHYGGTKMTIIRTVQPAPWANSIDLWPALVVILLRGSSMPSANQSFSEN